jgi:RimJ/RimL family protein N-acetyltransferase
MLDHAFRFVDTVCFLVGPENRRSRKALEKIGAVLSGTRTASVDGRQMELVRYDCRRGL